MKINHYIYEFFFYFSLAYNLLKSTVLHYEVYIKEIVILHYHVICMIIPQPLDENPTVVEI